MQEEEGRRRGRKRSRQEGLPPGELPYGMLRERGQGEKFLLTIQDSPLPNPFFKSECEKV